MQNKRKGLMLVLSSPSGAGKTSICKRVLDKEKDSYVNFLYYKAKKKK